MTRKFPTAIELLAGDPTADSHAARKLYVDTGLATKQPLDSDLTAIAAVSPADDDVLQRKSGAWTNRTPAQLKTDLALAVADVSGAAPTANPTFTGLVTSVRHVNTPQTQSVTTTLAIDASTGDNHQITATGNLAFGVPSNGTNGQMLLVEVLASGAARTVTLNGSIILSTGQSATMVIASGKVGVFGLRYSSLAGGWVLLAAAQTL